MFSRPVSSPWNPVPTSSRLATRPRISMRPWVGSVMRLRIFRSVLLPAPLRPMMPTTSPLADFKAHILQRPELFSFRGRGVSAGGPAERCSKRTRQRLAECLAALAIAADEYCFERCSTLIAMGSLVCMIDRRVRSNRASLTSNDVGEPALNPLEIGNADDKQTHRHAGRNCKSEEIERLSQKDCAESLDQSRHRVEIEKPSPLRRHEARRIDDRRHKHPQLHHEWHDVTEVTIGNRQSRQAGAHAERSEHHCEQQHRGHQQVEAPAHAIEQHHGEQNARGDGEIHDA